MLQSLKPLSLELRVCYVNNLTLFRDRGFHITYIAPLPGYYAYLVPGKVGACYNLFYRLNKRRIFKHDILQSLGVSAR